MQNPLLSIKNLSVSTGDIKILNDVSLDISAGETHVLMGPNGAGKSTLGYAIAGNPVYTVNNGIILFENNDITNEPADKRAAAGIFLSFQNPLEVPGITLANFIRTAYEQRTGENVCDIKYHHADHFAPAGHKPPCHLIYFIMQFADCFLYLRSVFRAQIAAVQIFGYRRKR